MKLFSDELGQQLIEFAFIGLVVALGAIAGMGLLASNINSEFSKLQAQLEADDNHTPAPPDVPDFVKTECEKLVAGQLAFAPIAKMQQGKTEIISARLARGVDPLITHDWTDGSKITVENTPASCQASITLMPVEQGDFRIERKWPPEKADPKQPVYKNKYTPWEWWVTPLRHGVLKLQLYVTPYIVIDGIGVSGKGFPQQPRSITVTADYVFEVKYSIVKHWAIWSVFITVILTPLCVWIFNKIVEIRKNRRGSRPAGFVQAT